MGLFNILGEHEHRTFNYKPIYYDPEKEELKRRFGSVDGSEKKAEGDTYVPGSHIQGAFRGGNYKRTKSPGGRAQNIIGLVGLVLIVVVLVYIAKFYTLL